MKRGVHAVAWVVLAVAAFVLWPERWGGSMTYVITSGSSMEPSFEQGDLAILRSSSDYEAGDVAAYDSTELKKIVMHRITEESDKGYTFQGDNNDFLDPETVTDDQMLGELVVRVPSVGTYLTWFLKPINLAIAAAALFFLFGDRKPNELGAAAAPIDLVALKEPIVVTRLEVPATVVRAEVASEEALRELATRYGRPLLQDASTEVLYVHDGAMLFEHDPQALVREREEHRGTGRDWCYDRTPVVEIPRPRRAAVPPVHPRRPRTSRSVS